MPQSSTITKGRFGIVALTIGYILFLVVATVYKYKRPGYNWDMLPYMALVVSIDHTDPKEVHAITYREARNSIPETAYKSLTDTANAYRKRMAEDPFSFRQQMPFYIVKPLYVGMIYFFYKLGFSLVTAAFLPSVLSYFGIGLLVFFWLRKHLNILFATLLSIFLQLAAPLLMTASFATPDCLSAFLLLCSFYFLIENNSLTQSYVFLLIAILTRLDNALLALVIISFLAFGNKWPKRVPLKHFLWMLSGIVATYLIAAYGATLYGWNILFLPTFYTKFHETFYQVRTSSLIKDYILNRHSAIMIAMLAHHLFIYLSFSFLLFIGNRSLRWNDLSFDQTFMVCLIFTIAVRAMIHTDLGDRFFIAYFALIPILLVRHLNQMTTNKLVNLTHDG